jgi:tRNA A-37 threonylcarbamoyl transferase component Bud32
LRRALTKALSGTQATTASLSISMSMEAGGGVADQQLDDEDESWTELEEVRPDLLEALPIRHGMVLGGRYTIEKVLGRGGCGVVVRAHDRVLKEAVAIKIVRAELATETVWAERLAREVKLARQIQHPHVCRVFDFQQADGRVFLVMELAARGTVREEIRTGALKARPLAARIDDARAVASALAAIHQAGIVHRDLTPQNLLRMSDGRVVLTDFGLATDAREGTSVAGGTISYMAPELLRGGRSSFVSDVWALGVVMHEIVFSDKPRWREGALVPEMLPPDLGRKLTDDEQIAFEACRACTDPDPARRLASPVEAARWLTERAGKRRRQIRISRGAAIVAGVCLGVVAATTALNVTMLRASNRRMQVAQVAQPPALQAAKPAPLIVPSGAPADWTQIAEVLAEVPERIHCARLLPDGHRIRFVWGTPAHAEDVDAVTRARTPSPLIPAAYAEGCPDLSSDGLRLVYQGHAPDGRPFAFVSQHPDGRDGVPVVQTAEPSMASEPTWLADGQTFSYDIDSNHMGVYSTAGGRMNVLPDVTDSSFLTMFRYVLGNRVYLGTQSEKFVTEIVGISVPLLKEEERFRVPNLVLDLRQDGRRFYFAQVSKGRSADIVTIDVASRTAHPIGHIDDQMLRYPLMTASGLAFVSVRLSSDLWARKPNGDVFNLTKNGHVRDVNRCGHDLIVSQQIEPERTVIQRIDASGKLIEQLSPGPADWAPACAPDGKTWYYRAHLPQPSIRRCDRTGCRDIFQGFGFGLSPSPDGRRLAYVGMDKRRGSIVQWIGADGGEPHDVVESETGCPVGWASDDTIWVSRRRGRKIVWTEVDADSGRETGKTAPGSHDCFDGRPDPASPVSPDLRVVYDQTSQVRIVGRDMLASEQ